MYINKFFRKYARTIVGPNGVSYESMAPAPKQTAAPSNQSVKQPVAKKNSPVDKPTLRASFTLTKPVRKDTKPTEQFVPTVPLMNMPEDKSLLRRTQELYDKGYRFPTWLMTYGEKAVKLFPVPFDKPDRYNINDINDDKELERFFRGVANAESDFLNKPKGHIEGRTREGVGATIGNQQLNFTTAYNYMYQYPKTMKKFAPFYYNKLVDTYIRQLHSGRESDKPMYEAEYDYGGRSGVDKWTIQDRALYDGMVKTIMRIMGDEVRRQHPNATPEEFKYLLLKRWSGIYKFDKNNDDKKKAYIKRFEQGYNSR